MGLIIARDNLVDNFSTHKEEVDKILAEGVKKLKLGN
jgi:homogentisate 1,2-dioxygenase